MSEKNPYSDSALPNVQPMPKPPDSRIIPLDRQNPLSHQQVEQVRFGLGDTGPLAQAVLNANVPALNKQLTIGAVSCLSTKRPSDPVIGQMIYETNTATTRIWDGSSWLANPPTGSIQPYVGLTAPSGWLICDGNAVLRATYFDLFSSVSISIASASTTNASNSVTNVSGLTSPTHVGWGIAGAGIPGGATITAIAGTTVTISVNATATASVPIVVGPYGFTGDNNVTTFNVPDLQGRVPFGYNTSNTDIPTIGRTEGAVLASRRPKHGHSATATASSTDAGHSHYMSVHNAYGWVGIGMDSVAGGQGAANWANVPGVQTGNASITTSVTPNVRPPDFATVGYPTDAPGYLTTSYIVKI